MRWFVPLLLAGPAAAQDASYFTGPYERIGRSGGPGWALIDDRVRIDPAPGGGLILTACPPAEPLPLDFDPEGEVPNLLTGRSADDQLDCQFFNDWSNYPLIACRAESGARFTLWAAPDAEGPGC